MLFLLQLIGILTGMTGYTDNYAHIGGCIGGILFGFATITTVAACDKCTLGERLATTKPFSYCFSTKTQEKLMAMAQARSKAETFFLFLVFAGSFLRFWFRLCVLDVVEADLFLFI